MAGLIRDPAGPRGGTSNACTAGHRLIRQSFSPLFNLRVRARPYGCRSLLTVWPTSQRGAAGPGSGRGGFWPLAGWAAAARMFLNSGRTRDYLVWSKRPFGVRGGKAAYQARLRSESVIEVEQAALVRRLLR